MAKTNNYYVLNFYILLLFNFLGGCISTPQNSEYSNEISPIDETSKTQNIEYYKLYEQTFSDNNGTIFKIKLPKNVRKIEGWDNTIIQYEWFSNGKRNIFSIDKLESSNTIKYVNNSKAYHDDIKYVWENEWKRDLNQLKDILPPYYLDVRIISFDTEVRLVKLIHATTIK